MTALTFMLMVYPIEMPPTCSCVLKQGVEDPTRATSFVRTYNLCSGSTIASRFAVDNEQYRARTKR